MPMAPTGGDEVGRRSPTVKAEASTATGRSSLERLALLLRLEAPARELYIE